MCIPRYSSRQIVSTGAISSMLVVMLAISMLDQHTNKAPRSFKKLAKGDGGGIRLGLTLSLPELRITWSWLRYAQVILHTDTLWKRNDPENTKFFPDQTTDYPEICQTMLSIKFWKWDLNNFAATSKPCARGCSHPTRIVWLLGRSPAHLVG